MVCPFCKIQWLPHLIQKHLESCPEKYFQCDLCCEKILEKDRNKHHTLQCKMLQDKISSDLYECPLCGEYLLEKDKSVHEFFACKTLLQIDEGRPLYSLHEKTSKKYAKEAEKALRSKYKYQYDDDANQTNQNDKFENEIQDVSPTSSWSAKEILRSKHSNENDDVHEASQKERVKSRTQNYSSSMSEKPHEMSISKHKYQCNDGIQTSQYEEYVSKIQGVSPSMSETSKEVLRLQRKYQNDNISEIIQKEKVKSRTQDASTFVPEKSFEMPTSRYKYQHDIIIQDNQKEETENKTQDVSPSMLTSKEEIKDLKSKLDKEKKVSKDFSSQMIRLNSLVKIGQDALTAEQEMVKKLKAELEETKKSESESLCHKPNPKTLVSETDLLSKHFKDLFTNESCSDTVVQVEDKEFKVHRAILSARSSVFSAMFQHDTTEKQTGIVKIPDCDADSFKVFLEYVYTGKLENISSNGVIHLYTISDKYNVQELKTSCTKYLTQNITVQNISEVVILADEYDEENLFSTLQDFFNKNFNEILLTKEWENLLKCNYRLVNKLLIGKSKADRNIK